MVLALDEGLANRQTDVCHDTNSGSNSALNRVKLRLVPGSPGIIERHWPRPVQVVTAYSLHDQDGRVSVATPEVSLTGVSLLVRR